MQLSARLLGQAYGLTAEEMNRALYKLGYLEGAPGEYSPTEKAMKFVEEHDFHRGCGGYSSYNRYWTTRSYDDSITDELDITPELIAEIREELAAVRKARSEARLAAIAKYEQERIDIEETKAEAARLAHEAIENREEFVKNMKKLGLVGLGVIAITGGYFCIKAAAPHVKKWWFEKKHAKENVDEKQKLDDVHEGKE